MKKYMKAATAALSLSIAVASGTAFADDVTLPKNLSWTSLTTSSSAYAQSVAIGQMLEKEYGTSLRVIPGNNDIARLVPIREKQTSICACGITALFAQEGAMGFGVKKWGPQKMYNLFNNLTTTIGQGLVTTKDSGIKTLADYRGKRIVYIKGAAAQNINAEAFLAFAGLTWDDVEQVVVPGWKQAADAIINGQADATWGATVTSVFNQIAASPRGIFWVSVPADDEEGWKRARAVQPLWTPALVEQGIEVDSNSQGKVPFEGVNYPYPIFVGSENLDDQTAYSLTKAVMENYDGIKDGAPSMGGYRLSQQPLKFAFPFQPGAIKYFREKGMWTEENDKHNEKLLHRIEVLQDAWASMDMSLDDDAFTEAWKKTRANALDAAGLDVPFRDW
ncbi:TAXI family TRAP transporter solute-binding subunit [Hwanghaeella sp. LZ110]|uniref:TAXI family TRAP transporter solute-binding subunit n=1 Tax=Hwanghaeella sp. LZ110 TaxID=3402810 RepID=UPI003B66C737